MKSWLSHIHPLTQAKILTLQDADSGRQATMASLARVQEGQNFIAFLNKAGLHTSHSTKVHVWMLHVGNLSKAPAGLKI